MPSPVVEVLVEDVAFGGNGVARRDGKAVFVPFTIDGERVTARVVREKKNFAVAELQAVIDPSPHRVKPRCKFFQKCGGCSYQHIAYERQLEIKSRQVEQTLRRVGKLAEPPMQPIIPSPAEYGYRNRIRMHIEDGVVGFYAHGSHRLIDIDSCPIASAEVNEALTRLRSRPVYDGDYTVSENTTGKFFEQVNTAVAREMLALVERLMLRGQSLLVDAYCGAGFFAKHLAPRFEKVIGIEENEMAVAHARQSAQLHEKYLAGSVELHLPAAFTGEQLDRTTLILDPPATGITPRVSDFILAAQPAEIIYVSCNPATLARDLALLCRSYRLLSVTPLDMFPQTAEIEVVAHLRK
ncbi:MAG TPA: class I SAM-dependent RNA methyltransferase [Chthoniobacteraceae bacterium]|nr:class I SAM-dependent RNA methyltransferase [Chthoniobacteraceae bacterium]